MNLNYVPIAATFSKDPSFWGHNFFPRCILEANGADVKGDDGRWYTDWVSGLGAVILGRGGKIGKSGFVSHLRMWAERGDGYSLPSYLEYSVAEKLCRLLGRHVPGWSPEDLQVRWVKSGSDACDAAVRLARAVTGRTEVLSQGYHGFDSDFVSMTLPHHGIISSEAMISFEIGQDLYTLDVKPVEPAAVIMEWPATDVDPDWVKLLDGYCGDTGALLIMDEVVTGLRWAPGGACEKYGIQPDLICMGKALGNGQAVSALIGPREYMSWFSRNDPVFVSSTHFGEVLGLAAADYVLDYVMMMKPDYYEHLWSLGAGLIKGLKECGYNIIGHPPRSLFQFNDDYAKAYFIAGMRDRGHLVNRPNFPTMAHTQLDVIDMVRAASEVMTEMLGLGPEGIKNKVGEKLPKVLFRNR